MILGAIFTFVDIALFLRGGGEGGGVKRGCLWEVGVYERETVVFKVGEMFVGVKEEYALGEWAIVFMGVKRGVYQYVSGWGKG